MNIFVAPKLLFLKNFSNSKSSESHFEKITNSLLNELILIFMRFIEKSPPPQLNLNKYGLIVL